MPKKLKLDDLKIQSFVTNLEKEDKKKVKAGEDDTCFISCDCGSIYSCGACVTETCSGLPNCSNFLICGW